MMNIYIYKERKEKKRNNKRKNDNFFSFFKPAGVVFFISVNVSHFFLRIIFNKQTNNLILMRWVVMSQLISMHTAFIGICFELYGLKTYLCSLGGK